MPGIEEPDLHLLVRRDIRHKLSPGPFPHESLPLEKVVLGWQVTVHSSFKPISRSRYLISFAVVTGPIRSTIAFGKQTSLSIHRASSLYPPFVMVRHTILESGLAILLITAPGASHPIMKSTRDPITLCSTFTPAPGGSPF